MAFSSIVCCVVLSMVAAFACGQSATTSAANKCQMNGNSYDIGSMFDGTDAFYYCKKSSTGAATAEAIGCISNGQRVYDLALYQKGDNFYRCRAGDTTVSSDLWGCAMKNADGSITPKSIACTWDVGTDPINYVQCCVQKGGTAIITQLYCLYTYRGGRVQVNEGCYRYFPGDGTTGGTAAGCTRNPDGTTLTLTTWSAKDATSAGTASQANGMSQCSFDFRN